MSLQTRTETVSAAEVRYELEADSGLSDEAKQALAGAAAAGGVLEKRTTYRETSPIAIEKGAGWVLAFLDNFRQLLNAGITTQEMRIVAYVLDKMEYGNLVCLSQTATAKDFNCSQQAISKHFKSLEKRGFFVKSGGHLFVNSTIFAKGLATRMDEERRQHLAAAQDTRGGRFKTTLKVKKVKA
ncbi:replication/maintenance protein RepL [Pseudoxanthomonas suwonensis]|uniref:replication/maintenance protein RepL n=1 Tax=Pseudoxanthomonas suwonensis TaxID=314722 RepID=UPI000685B5D6|nr:replication/maintenance protein RepL [Pseudoxanthomonas suwonensis]